MTPKCQIVFVISTMKAKKNQRLAMASHFLAELFINGH